MATRTSDHLTPYRLIRLLFNLCHLGKYIVQYQLKQSFQYGFILAGTLKFPLIKQLHQLSEHLN